MTDARWAERVARALTHNWFKSTEQFRDDSVVGICALEWEQLDVQISKAIEAEHARAIRLVKAEMKRVKKDQYVFTAQTKGYLLEMLNHLLTALQRGRGGKG